MIEKTAVGKFMSNDSQKILSHVEPQNSVAGKGAVEEILRHAKRANAENLLLIFAAPRVGVSEILRQVYDRMFTEQETVIPFYFSLDKNDRNARKTAVRFLQTFLRQTVAFRRCNSNLLSFAPDVCEISELADAQDAAWIEKLISTCRADSHLSDESSFVRTALSAPLRAHAAGAKVFVMIDDLQRAANIAGEANFLDEMKEIFSRANFPVVLAGRRRFMSGVLANRTTKVIRLNNLSEAEAVELTEKSAAKFAVKINEQTRDLVIRQLSENQIFVPDLFATAQKTRTDLDNYSQVQTVFGDAIFKGKFGRYYGELFDEILPNRGLQTKVTAMLRETAESEFQTGTIETWSEKLNLSFDEVWKIVHALHTEEIVRVSGQKIEFADENFVLADYVSSRSRIENSNEPRALVIGDILSNSIKRAPQIMADFYRRSTAINLKELMTAFGGQKISSDLFDYGVFKENYKQKNVENASETTLPQIVYAANTTAFYPPLATFAEPERSCVAIGFEADETETVWIAVQIDSKLKAAKDVTEFWCDRLETVALMCNFLHYKLWLIAPEGFSDEALEVLYSRNVFGSSRRQVELIVKELNAQKVFRSKDERDEYEMIFPMGDDTELIAAGAVEEIARRNGFKPKEINQIKTALVEACINAAEHSHSPDRKIYQKFKVEENKIIITVANRGIKIPTEKILQSTAPINPNEGRRGWGLKLMQTLMDDVKFEQTDDGTRISMTKYKKD